MPYIDKKVAENIDAGMFTSSPGELTYELTKVACDYLEERKGAKGKLQFHDFAEVITALECAKLEFYRRILAEYEDKKRGNLDNIDPYENV